MDTIQCYYNGAWINAVHASVQWNGVVYSQGVDYKGYTSVVNNGVITFGATSITLYNSTAILENHASIYWQIDLSMYTKVIVKAKGNNAASGIYGRMYVGTSPYNGHEYAPEKSINITTTTQSEYTIDVTALTGKHYITLNVGIASTTAMGMTVTELRVE